MNAGSVFFFSCSYSSKGLLTSFECLLFLLYLWASNKPDSGISSSHNVWNLRHCSRAVAAVFAWRAFVYLLFDDWRQSSALSYYDQYPLNQYQVILKKQKGYLSQSEMEKYSDWIGWSCSGVGFGFCYATPIESGTFQCYERVLRGIMQHPGISDDYLSGL